MADFFTKERRIEENRQRLRELFEQYKKTENYYPLFLAYFTAFSIYFFDFIALLFNSFPCYFLTLTIFTGLSFLYVIYLIWKFFDSVDWNFDYLPFGVYSEYPQEIKDSKPELVEGSNEFKTELQERYIKDLEEFVKKDSDIYVEKKRKLSNIWKPMIISLLLYSLNITAYKIITTKTENIESLTKTVMSPQKIVAKESIVEKKSHISDTVNSEKKIIKEGMITRTPNSNKEK
jgi:hypothetical protein